MVAAITFLSLTVGELVPKRLALNAPERVAAMVARPMRLLAELAGPLVSLLALVTDGVLRLLRVRPPAEAAITEEEVRALIAQAPRRASPRRRSASWWRAPSSWARPRSGS